MSLSSSSSNSDGLNFSSFSINLFTSTSNSLTNCNDSDVSSSSYDCSDTQCSSLLLRTMGNLSGKSAKNRIKHSDKKEKIRKDLTKHFASASPIKESSPSHQKHIELKSKQRSKQPRLSTSSSSSSNMEGTHSDILINTSFTTDLSFPLCNCSNTSISLPSPIMCPSPMATKSTRLSTPSTPQFRMSTPCQSEEAQSFSIINPIQCIVEKETTQKVDIQGATTGIQNLDVTKECQENDHTESLQKDVPASIRVLEEHIITCGPVLQKILLPPQLMSPTQVMHSPIIMRRPTSISPMLVRSCNTQRRDEECVPELPSTSSFYADEVRTIAPLFDLPTPPLREQQRNYTTTRSAKKTLNDVGNTTTLSFQLPNSFFVDEAKPNWTAPSPSTKHGAKTDTPPLIQPASNVTNQPFRANRLVDAKKKLDSTSLEVKHPSNFSVKPAERQKIEDKLESEHVQYLKTKDGKGGDFCQSPMTNAPKLKRSGKSSGQSPSQNQLRRNMANVRVETVGTKMTPEVHKNVVKSAERFTVNSIRTYYIKKMQEMEAKHQKQMSDIKSYQFIGNQQNISLIRDKEKQRNVISNTNRMPSIDSIKMTLQMQNSNSKDSSQQTDPSSEVITNPIDQLTQAARLQGLQNRIAKLISDNLPKEQQVQRLTEQLKDTNTELQNARQELLSKVRVISGCDNAHQMLDPIRYQKLQKSLEISQVKSIQLQNQVDNLQFENCNLQIQLSSATCVTEGSHILVKYSNLSRKICELEQRAICREEEIQAKINDIQRKTAADNERLQVLHEEEIREKDEKLTVLKTKLDCTMKKQERSGD